MAKIRIGNDIRLAVDLRQYLGEHYLYEREVYDQQKVEFENIDSNPFVNKKYEVYSPNQYDESSDESITIVPEGTPISIRSVKAILINTSKEEERKEFMKKKTRFIARYPIEPCIGPFHATPYDVMNSGYPTWRAYPHAYCAAPYHGYGWHPEWGGIYKPLPHKHEFEYFAPVMATAKQHQIEVSFPARAQRFTGVYKLVIVAEVFAPGFNRSNLKTITVDMPDVFELVKTTEEGINTGIGINVDTVKDVLPSGDAEPDITYNDIYVDEGSYGDNIIKLDRTDGTQVGVDVSEFTAWYEGD